MNPKRRNQLRAEAIKHMTRRQHIPKPKKKRELLSGFLSIIAAFTVLTLWFKWRHDLQGITDAGTSSLRGQYGDAFGSLNTLFTGLAFVGVAYSIHLQRRESRARETEYLEEKDYSEARRQEANAFRAKEEYRLNQIEQRRSFEEHFFSLTNAFNARVQSIQVQSCFNAKARGQGYTAFPILRKDYISFRDCCEYGSRTSDENSGKSESAFNSVYDENHTQLAAYFRLLYQIYKYLDSSPAQNKLSYSNIIRAGLTTDELAMLALNSRTEFAVKFLPFYKKYALLKHLTEDHIGEETLAQIKDFVGPLAFKDVDELNMEELGTWKKLVREMNTSLQRQIRRNIANDDRAIAGSI